MGVLLALSKKAAIYVFDEPLSGLESAAKSRIMKVIIDRTKAAILVVTLHEPELVTLFTHHLDMSGDTGDGSLTPTKFEKLQISTPRAVQIGV